MGWHGMHCPAIRSFSHLMSWRSILWQYIWIYFFLFNCCIAFISCVIFVYLRKHSATEVHRSLIIDPRGICSFSVSTAKFSSKKAVHEFTSCLHGHRQSLSHHLLYQVSKPLPATLHTAWKYLSKTLNWVTPLPSLKPGRSFPGPAGNA